MKPVYCDFVQSRRSAFIDESLPSAEAVAIRSHLQGCSACSADIERTFEVQQAVRALPRKRVHPSMTIALRVLASKERVRQAKLRNMTSMVAAFHNEASLWFNNLMRPLAIPMAGGVMAATLVFSMIVGSYPLRGDSISEDVPTRMYTEAVFKGMVPLDFSAYEVVVDLVIDGQGRVLDYKIAGGDLENDIKVYRSLNNMLLFTEFRPATSFGQPVSAKLRLSFRRGHIEVRG